MSTGAILQGKKEVVNEIKEKMQKAEAFVIVDYKGITVEQDTILRSNARESGVDYKIYKNTLLRFAAKECGYDELTNCLVGSSAIAFCDNDVVAPAKVIAEYVKSSGVKTLEFKGGVIDGKISSVDEITKIATLPSREVLLSQMLGSLNAPISNFARVINQIREKAEESA